MPFSTGSWGEQAQARSVKRIEYFKKYNKTYNADVRQRVIKAYGGKCVKCGFADWRALQLDHINGGGSLESKKGITGRRRNLDALYNVDKKYQLLCANCNWIKRYEMEEVLKK